MLEGRLLRTKFTAIEVHILILILKKPFIALLTLNRPSWTH